MNKFIQAELRRKSCYKQQNLSIIPALVAQGMFLTNITETKKSQMTTRMFCNTAFLRTKTGKKENHINPPLVPIMTEIEAPKVVTICLL